MAKQLTRLRELGAKVETTEGTFIQPGATDAAILVYDPKVDTDVSMFDRTPAKDTLGQLAPVAGVRQTRMTFRTEVKGQGAAGGTPEVDVLLAACGMKKVIVGGASVTYSLLSVHGLSQDTHIVPVSLELRDGSVAYQAKGARGTFRLMATVGEPAFYEWSFLGVFHAVSTSGVTFNPTYQTTVPSPFLSAAAQIHGFTTPVIRSCSLDLGNDLQIRQDANSAAGNLSTLVVARNPSGEMDPEMEQPTGGSTPEPFYTDWIDGTTGNFTFKVGSTPGNICTVNAPSVSYRKITDAERTGISVAGLAFSVNENVAGSNDDFTIAYT